MVSFPPFRLDDEQGRLWKGESVLALRRKPFEILRYLAAHPKKLVTHDDLLAHVWQGAVVSESAVRSHMHELRQVLGEGVIETVVGRGYRFIAELEGGNRAAPESPAIDPLVVGRDAELATLSVALERARDGRRQMCFVTGEPGIGKSTLARTFLAGLDPRTVMIATGNCFEQHATPEPYLPIIDALSELARSSSRGAQNLAALIRYAPTFLSQVPSLVDDAQLAEVTRRATGGHVSRLLRELSEAIEAMCSQDPIVIVLEDLQWSDVATIDLLSLLGQRRERAKLLVIATARAEILTNAHPLYAVMRSLVARSGAIAIQVPGMPAEMVQEFIDRRFAGNAFPPELTKLVAHTTGGTPLFIVSLLDELASRGMLAERDGRWTLTVPIEDVEAHRPTSVKQLIDIQLDRLPAADQRVLEAASVVGAVFSTELVGAALETSAVHVDERCDALARRSLFIRMEPDGQYGVTHALVQEVCSDRTSPVRRQHWHRRVAEALEQRGGDVAHLLAKHYDGANEPARAIPKYVAAGRQAALKYAASDVVAACNRALELLARLPANRDRDLLELQILSLMTEQVSSNSLTATFAGRDPLAVHGRGSAQAPARCVPSHH